MQLKHYNSIETINWKLKFMTNEFGKTEFRGKMISLGYTKFSYLSALSGNNFNLCYLNII